MSVSLADEGLDKFVAAIAARTGLQIREHDRAVFARKLSARMRAEGHRDLQAYYEYLEGAFGSAQATGERAAWQKLIDSLVVTESYFFRDRGQFDLLRNRILPEAIARRLKACGASNFDPCQPSRPQPHLRIWSAGCSTGEEPYSLAILVRELLPRGSYENVSIVGTDISEAALEKARRGIYTNWSFRALDRDTRDRYFRPQGQNWELDPEIRQLVRFQPFNLAGDRPLEAQLYDLDLILCRNVFIYLKPATIARAMTVFFETLRPGGVLMTAHSEVSVRESKLLEARVFPQSTVYARPEDNRPLERDSTRPAPFLSPVPAVSPPIPSILANVPSPATAKIALRQTAISANIQQPQTDRIPESAKQNDPSDRPAQTTALARAGDAFQAGNYPQAVAFARQQLQTGSHAFDAYYLLARAHANLGDYNQATYYCNQALELDSLSISCYYLLARIAEERGNLERAKALLKRVLYLEPQQILAYLELGGIYTRQGDRDRARKMQTVARDLLAALSPETLVDEQQSLLAKDLLQQVDTLLEV